MNLREIITLSSYDVFSSAPVFRSFERIDARTSSTFARRGSDVRQRETARVRFGSMRDGRRGDRVPG
jgi:hypothetical protein